MIIFPKTIYRFIEILIKGAGWFLRYWHAECFCHLTKALSGHFSSIIFFFLSSLSRPVLPMEFLRITHSDYCFNWHSFLSALKLPHCVKATMLWQTNHARLSSDVLGSRGYQYSCHFSQISSAGFCIMIQKLTI